tara:strand:+ start:16252 stop:16671 length:420 start_codon:yes stop_codon:yes gene_type:complete
MAGFSNYLEDKIINHVFGGTAYTAPSTCYVALYTSAPTESSASTANEVSGGGYARQSVGWTIQGSGTARALSNAALTFPAATSDWGSVTHAAVVDHVTAGNILSYETLTKTDYSTANPKTVNTGDIFQIDAGNLRVELD